MRISVVRSAIPPEEVKVLDLNARHLGVRTIELMENAGAVVARHVLDGYPAADSVGVLCGRGNNGGDGFVAARYLSNDKRVTVFTLEEPSESMSDLTMENLSKVRGLSKNIVAFSAKEHDVVVDAMLGIGLRGRPREPYAKTIRNLNRSRKRVVSVDVPSGWPSDLSVRADATVTFHAPKKGMNRKNSGRIVVADIGIPDEAEKYCGPGDFSLLPARKPDARKGDAGRVLVIGGGPYTGAPAFAGMAAMRAGADLAFVATPEPAALPVAVYSPSLIVRSLEGERLSEDHVTELLTLSRSVDVVAIGPGLGSASETIRGVQRFVQRCAKPMVIDADAIHACGAQPQILRKKSAVITPHAGEFRRLTGKALGTDDPLKRGERVKEGATKLRATILLKGQVDVISDGTYIKLNRTGNNALAVGGTGDVLTGLVASLIAQGAQPFHAARIGAFAMGLAGDLAFEEKSYGLVATDVIEKIPIVLRRYELDSRE
ncbi:MAG: NAD(P)H-hydrate dehydratase [Methanobacteriota archaeon]|nr:MAG: NAD(P)H-hydrate dehydratase [Euryarchaeota archaeon]